MPDPDDESAAILREATVGKPLREIAKARGMLQSEVARIIDLAAQNMFSGKGTRREVLLEAQRLGYMKQRLWERYMRDGDTPSPALYIKASERLSSMLGWNHPLGHVVQITGHLEQPHDDRTMTARTLEAVRRLRGEYEAEQQSKDEPPDEDKLN